MIILPANTLSTGGYEIANSCRFEDGDTPVMTRTTETPTNSDKYTFSVWVKRGNLGLANSKIFSIQNGTYGEEKLEFNTDDIIWRQTAPSDGNTTYERVTDRKFLDPSAWYHILIAYDSSDGTAGDRMKMYINGVRETSFSGTNNPSSNEDSVINTASKTLTIAKLASGSGQHFDGYFAEMAFVDGVAHAVTDFGEFDSDSPQIWKPKDISSGITWGNNGFWLDFEDSSALGNDVSGNNNDFSVSNLAAIDQCSDSPTNNFCTMNPLDNYYAGSTFKEGNCRIVTAGTPYTWNTSTFGLSAGKWYMEFTIIDEASGGSSLIGISDRPSISATEELGGLATTYAYLSSGNFRTNNSNTSNSVSATDGDIIGIALNLDDNEISYYKNNVLIVGAQSITAPASTATGFYFIASADWLDGGSDICTHDHNFGNPVVAHSSAQSDANNYGSFEYAPPTGFLAICTKNLGSDGG